MHIDLNSDLGESYGAWKMGNDEQILSIVSSANIACGFHAGDPLNILSTLKQAACTECKCRCACFLSRFGWFWSP